MDFSHIMVKSIILNCFCNFRNGEENRIFGANIYRKTGGMYLISDHHTGESKQDIDVLKLANKIYNLLGKRNTNVRFYDSEKLLSEITKCYTYTYKTTMQKLNSLYAFLAYEY